MTHYHIWIHLEGIKRTACGLTYPEDEVTMLPRERPTCSKCQRYIKKNKIRRPGASIQHRVGIKGLLAETV